jgi:hypothetical protein
MHVHEIIIPLTERLLGVDDRQIKYYINPRYAETISLLSQKSHYSWLPSAEAAQELRGYMIGGNLYVWYANDNIHHYGRVALHREFGIGKDAFSGRPLVLRLRKDGTIDVMLGGIRRSYYISVNDEMIDKSARLRDAVRPPEKKTDA